MRGVEGCGPGVLEDIGVLYGVTVQHAVASHDVYVRPYLTCLSSYDLFMGCL
jgi:hypothetical protein